MNHDGSALLAERSLCLYPPAMNWLTKQEQLVIAIVFGLLLTGWVVKHHRAAQTPTTVSQPAKP
jgi:hypothetical protein